MGPLRDVLEETARDRKSGLFLFAPDLATNCTSHA